MALTAAKLSSAVDDIHMGRIIHALHVIRSHVLPYDWLEHSYQISRSDPPRADRPFGVTIVKPYSAPAPLHCAACIPHLHPGNARC